MDGFIFLKTGEWIAQHGVIPRVDVFSYLNFGAPWVHVKWGYSFLVYQFYTLAGSESAWALVQGLVNVLIVLLLFKSTQKLNPNWQPGVVQALLLVLFFTGIEYRMIARPEQFSHLFTALFLYILIVHRKGFEKAIWTLPILQLLWCNLHDAFVLGWVLLGIYTAFTWGEAFWLKRPKPIRLSLVFLISMAGSTLSVLGLEVFFYPLSMAHQLQTNQYTPELFSCALPEYWQHKEGYIILIFMLLHGFIWYKAKRNVAWLHVLLVLAFLVLGLRTYRNIAFFMLVQMPFVWAYFSVPKQVNGLSKILTYILLLGFYVGIVSDVYYKAVGSKERYGLGISSVNTPVKGVEYMIKNGFSAPVFSDYLSSAYLLWKLPNSYKTYLDLRDLDVFGPQHFEHYYRIMQNPALFEQELVAKGIETVTLYTADAPQIHRYLYGDSTWKLVYVDVNMAVYTKRMHAQKELEINLMASQFYNTKLEQFVNQIFNPFFKAPIFEKNRYVLARYFFNVQDLTRSTPLIEQAYKQDAQEEDVVMLWVKHLFVFAANDPNPGLLYQEIKETLLRYEAHNAQSFLCLKALALVSVQLHEKSQALDYAKRALEIQPDEQLRSLIQ